MMQEESSELIDGAHADDAVTAQEATQAQDAAELERIHAENKFIRAMDEALTDVRQRSYEGKLTKSSRWRKLALTPEGMDARAFEEQLRRQGTPVEAHYFEGLGHPLFRYRERLGRVFYDIREITDKFLFKLKMNN